MPPTAPQPAQPQPPFGSSPATGPTQNAGYEAQAAQQLGFIVKQLEQLVAKSGATSEIGKVALDALNKLVKFVPQGAVSPASQRNQIEQMAMKNTEQGQSMQALQQRMQGGQQGAQGPPQPQATAA